MSNLVGSRLPLVRATAEGKQAILLLAELGRDLLRAQQAYNSGLSGSRDNPDLLVLARFHYLRLEQLRRTEQRLLPAGQAIREFAGKMRGDRELVSLKLRYQDGGSTKTKTVLPAFDAVLSESLHRGDTLSQVLRVASVGLRDFAIAPDAASKGKIPLWIIEWEDSGYALDFYPPSFDGWATVRLDRPNQTPHP